MNRTIKNEQEFQDFLKEVRNRQYEVDPVIVDVSDIIIYESYDWDNEYLEIVRVDNVDVVKLRSCSTLL